MPTRSDLIRQASTLPAGDPARRAILRRLQGHNVHLDRFDETPKYPDVKFRVLPTKVVFETAFGSDEDGNDAVLQKKAEARVEQIIGKMERDLRDIGLGAGGVAAYRPFRDSYGFHPIVRVDMALVPVQADLRDIEAVIRKAL